MANQLEAGQQAPDFELVDHENNTVSLQQYRGQPVIIYFYPKAETPGCTTEACDFRDNIASLTASGYKVLGVSPDDSSAIQAFRENHQLSFPLLSDPDKQTIQAWGAWGEKTVNGKEMTGVLRSTIVLNADGVVELAQYNVQADGHVAALRQELGLS